MILKLLKNKPTTENFQLMLLLLCYCIVVDFTAPDSPEDTDGDRPVSSSEDEDDDAGSISQHSECSASQQQQHPLDASKSSFRRLQFPRDSGCYDSSITAMKERLHTHHRHHHHKKPPPAGFTLQHHHHHKSCRGSSSKCSKEGRDQVKEGCMGLLRSQGDCTTRTHCNTKEIPNNLDSGLITSLQHPLLQQCVGGHGSGVGMETVKGSEMQYRGGGGKLQGAVADIVDSDEQGTVLSSPVPQQQNFLPNIPVTSSSMTSSPVTQLPSADFTGIMGGGRNLISASSISTSISSSSPIRTCAGSSFGAELKLDSYVVARGKLVAVETCRKAGSPSASPPVGSLRSSSKQQVLDSPSSKHSPSNPFCAITANASVVDVSPQAAPSPSSCGGGGSGAVIVSEDSCETNTKLTMVKYVVGGSSDLGLGCESGNVMGIGRGGCCLSEKSSDSGVSSSSLSSANPKENCGRKEGRAIVPNNAGQSVVESPTRGFISYGSCISNNHRSSSATNTNKGLVLQGPDKNSYQ